MRDLTTNYFAEADLRLGWTFVDAEGRSWEAVSSRVAGRADAWWMRALPKWIHHPRYRLALEFEERPPVSFDAVKSRLFAAVTANPEAYPDWYRGPRRAELRAAKCLSDLIKSEEARAIERLEPTAAWWQWLFGEGRCSRRGFTVAGVIVAAAIWLDVALRIQMPMFLVVVILSFGICMSAVVRRLHDLGRTAWWIGAWWLLSFLCAQVFVSADARAMKAIAAGVWQIATLAALGYLALAPGTRETNRYGFARG